MNYIVKLLKALHESRQREADRVIRRYWHLVERAHEYERRYNIETTKPTPLLNKASTTGFLAQAVFGSKATMLLRHVVAIVAILAISFGAKMFFFSPPTVDAGHPNIKNLPASTAHSNARSMHIGEPSYP